MATRKKVAVTKTAKTKTDKPKATATSTSIRYTPIAKRTYELETSRGSKSSYKKKKDPKTGKITYLKGFKTEYSHKRTKSGEATKSKRKY